MASIGRAGAEHQFPTRRCCQCGGFTRQVGRWRVISIWVLVILGAGVQCADDHPTDQGSFWQGVRAIALGDFEARIAFARWAVNWAELLQGFNDIGLHAWRSTTPPTLKNSPPPRFFEQQTLFATMADGGCPCWMARGRIVRCEPHRPPPVSAGRAAISKGPNELCEELSEVLAMGNYRSPSRPFSGRTGQATDVRCSFGEPPRTFAIVLQT